MNLRSLATRLLVLCSALCALAFAGDDDNFYFSLSSSQIYYPGSTETSVDFSGNGLGSQTVYMRAFKVTDPVEFFKAQKDPHNPRLNAEAPPNTFDMIRQGYQKVTRDARYAARDVMPADARRAIRDVADLNGTKAEKEAEKKRPAPAKDGKLAVDDIPKGAERYPIVATWEHRLQPKDKDRDWHYETIPVPIKERGVYLIEARTRGKRAITALIISEYGMVVKEAATELLTFVVNTQTGEKVTDFPVTIMRGGQMLAEKETGSDGTLRTAIPILPRIDYADDNEDHWRWEYRRRMVMVVGEKNGNFVINDPDFYPDGESGSRIYLHTDRPIYRPSQTVYYRGIARRVNEDGTYAVPPGNDSVYVEIQDARGDMVRRDTLALNDLGTFNGQLTLGDEPPLGDYSIKVVRRGGDIYDEQWFNFSVEEYKKPEYKVVVTTDRAHYTRGDKITATVKADYFFGSPVANGEVEYFVYRARYWRPWWRGSDWAYLYEDGDDAFSVYRMEMVSSGKGEIASDGTFNIEYTTDPKAELDYVYRVQANVVDASRRSIAGAKSVEVTRGEFYIATRTDRYVYKPGDKARIALEIKTFEGERPVATSFTADVLRTWWDRIKNDTLAGGYEYKKRTQKIWSGSGSTDGSGKGSIDYATTEPGYFEVVIGARDARGTLITESEYIYVASSTYANWYREGSSDVQIIPDKPAYKPGETMNALVIMPAPNIDVLMTVEGSTIFRSQVERLDGTSTIVHIPIEERYAPTVYLSASAMVNNELYTEMQRVSVVPEGKLLKLEVTADREIYRPGDKGTVMVRALDESGSPVSNVDVAIGMVDEAIYAIRPDATPDIQRHFYGTRWNEVYTGSSLNFSFYGDATKIDKDATDALYGSRSRSSETYRLDVASRAGARQGLAFGDVKGTMFVQPVTRKNFKDMMYWAPSVRTGADGRAKVEVDFPDNLTTWRITARGVTANTAVGQATAQVIARKELLVRMETPRFMIQGDELLIATTVHNYLSSEKMTKVEMTGENVALTDRSRTITIPANGEKRIDWKVTAPRKGSATLTVKALTNEESDAMELAVPVLPNGIRMATGSVAEIETPAGIRTMNITIPPSADPMTGEVYVTLSPSLAGSFLGALDSLIGYPYGCVEQTMSRFLPTVVVADALRKLDIPFDEKRRAEIPKMVAKGLSKLYGMQHDDGGWGWWANDKTDPFMTAYVIYGMTVARSAGYGISEDRYDNGVAALTKMVETGQQQGRGGALDATSEAYMLYVLSIANKGTPKELLTRRITSMSRRDTVNDYGRSLLALAAVNQGMRDLALTMTTKIEKNVVTSGDYAYWKPKGPGYFWQNDAVETSANVLRALLELRGASPLVEKGVRWILAQKVGDEWHSTRQTAMVIYSLIDYVKSAGELSPNYMVSVKVNGQELYTKRMTSADVFVPEQRIKLEGTRLTSGANNITIEKNGPGRLYSTSRVVYYATGPALRAASAGFKVTRQYFTLRRERRGEIIVHTKQPFNGTARSGDEIFVKVKVVPDRRYEYFMLEDPLPAGCEVVTNTQGYTIPGEADYDYAKREEEDFWSWNWWYAERNIRDEKVSFFARDLPASPQEFSYILRAQIPGRYAVLPAVGMLMYYPEVRGNSDALAMVINP